MSANNAPEPETVSNELAYVMRAHGIDDVGFGRYMVEVDRHILRVVGLRSLDLEDYHYRDNYDDDVSPRTTAREALNYAGWSS